MSKLGILISSAIGLVAVAGVAATTLSLGAVTMAAAETTAASSMFGRHHGWRHGGNRIARICSPARGEKVEHGIVFVENFMNFTTPQQQAWDGLAQAVRAGNARVDEACATLKDGKMPTSATEKFAMAETVLSAGLDIVMKVRPAFDQFYKTLNSKQQKSLDDLLSRRHHG